MDLRNPDALLRMIDAGTAISDAHRQTNVALMDTKRALIFLMLSMQDVIGDDARFLERLDQFSARIPGSQGDFDIVHLMRQRLRSGPPG